MRTAMKALGIALLLGAAGCATTKPDCVENPDCARAETTPRAEVGYTVHELGEHFVTDAGSCKVIRVQDDYRLIRCINRGSIQGCYEDLLTVPRLDLELMRWRPVEGFEGLELAFLTPDRIAVRQTVLVVLPSPAAPSENPAAAAVVPGEDDVEEGVERPEPPALPGDSGALASFIR